MKTLRILCQSIAMTVVLMGAAVTVHAAAPVVLKLSVMKEVRRNAADGTTRIQMMPVDKAVPGDRLVYTLIYANTGAQPVSDLVLNYPLPAGIVYRAPQDGAQAPELSIDGASYGALSTLGTAAHTSTTDDVTHLRWRVAGPVMPGKQGEISFKATLK